jgi:hypothetical protein
MLWLGLVCVYPEFSLVIPATQSFFGILLLMITTSKEEKDDDEGKAFAP